MRPTYELPIMHFQDNARPPAPMWVNELYAAAAFFGFCAALLTVVTLAAG